MDQSAAADDGEEPWEDLAPTKAAAAGLVAPPPPPIALPALPLPAPAKPAPRSRGATSSQPGAF